MKNVLTEIQNGSFARNWILENYQANRPYFNATQKNPVRTSDRKCRRRTQTKNELEERLKEIITAIKFYAE